MSTGAAIFAGTALAVALSFVLLTFGSAIGLSVSSFEPGEGVSLRWLGIASGLWFLWVAITCFRRPAATSPGGCAGRCRARASMRSRCATARMALSSGRWARSSGRCWRRAELPASWARPGALAGHRGTRRPVEAVGGDVGYLGLRLLRGDGADAAAVLTRNLGEGEMSAEDRDYLVVAGGRADRADSGGGRSGGRRGRGARRSSSMPRRSRRREQARVVGAIAAFLIAATLMASAAAAYLAAAAGGDHRDRNVPFGTARPPLTGKEAAHARPHRLAARRPAPGRADHRLPYVTAPRALYAAASSAWCLASSASAFCMTRRTPRAAWRMRCSFSTRPRRT